MEAPGVAVVEADAGVRRAGHVHVRAEVQAADARRGEAGRVRRAVVGHVVAADHDRCRRLARL